VAPLIPTIAAEISTPSLGNRGGDYRAKTYLL
jgi:hypothetical protein